MSFDGEIMTGSLTISKVSIPFEQGDVFRHFGNVDKSCIERSQSLSSRAMSFDRNRKFIRGNYLRLNPFRAGRCLSTNVSCRDGVATESQSLSSRAMSFDCSGMLEAGIMRLFSTTSQFFWKVKVLALDLSK